MRISFCYIHGISAIDTPYFETVSDQTFFFERHEVGYVSVSFYPPHYQNSIRISTEDFNFNEEINYVRFQYLNKWYYYFIDSIEYVNENLFQINITMDVIQTYFFNIEIDGGIIERKFINRWNADKSINRNYIRENISNNNLVTVSKDYDSVLYDDDLWIVIKVNKDVHADQRLSFNTKLMYPLHEMTVDSPYKYMFWPIKASNLEIYDNVNHTSITKTLYPPVTYLKDISPYIVDAFIVHGFPVNDGFSYNHDGTAHILNNICGLKLYGSTEDYVFTPITEISSTSIDALFSYSNEKAAYDLGRTDAYANTVVKEIRVINDVSLLNNLSFTRNTSININFNTSFIPALLDENYILYEYGNDNATTSYPLFSLKYKYDDTNKLSLKRWTDVITGCMCYITNYGSISSLFLGNEYSTYVCDTNIPFYDIILDSSSQWLIDNHSRLVAAGIQLGSQAVRCVASGIAGGITGGMTKSMSSFTGVGSRDMRFGSRTGSFVYSQLPLKKTVQRAMHEEVGKIGSESGDVSGPIGNYVNLVKSGLLVHSEVVQGGMQPNIVKQTGNYSNKISGFHYCTWQRIMKVNDYEQVAHYYHRNGYRVDEFIGRFTQNLSNIFDYVNTRYYYNILKMMECNVHLISVIEDETTCSIITDRLVNGIRLWNIATVSELQDKFDIGTYQYDNVEKSYL